ncbi:AraC family transcriptional regulator [Gloeocapsopsis sp. IPPAS B-1203]|uniref:helix-turn-helix transcriptional regulator n=1 Tax=Gloeocapsopsis sp. IPPAS B-1203 TaxID=2049454 RepID=UPI000C182C41|nr:AraC family transcriptional regulator [Gloeocapsopsis sp. IPPAS B-1203]PIG94311.1 transcriptional regulator [Gloeocapsopsis sp. IPPAS B-1203]
MKILPAEEYWQVREESIKTNGKWLLNHDGFDEIWQCDNQFSNDQVYLLELRPGLDMSIGKHLQHTDLNYVSPHYEIPYPITSKFHLSGNYRTITPGIKEICDEYIERIGNHYLFYLPDLYEIHQVLAEEDFLIVSIYIEIDVFKTFSQGFESLPTPLQALINKKSPPRFHYPVGEITPAMFRVLQQILNPPFQGMMKRMYLESRVLELLALQLNQFLHHERAIKAVTNLRAIDIEKAYHARDILIRRAENPPSLMKLAELVGVGDRKLRYCFREVFGTTVFGYLHDYRMEQAKVMLGGTKMQVAEVANAVGYSHLGYFAKAFKAKFGISPKEFQFGKKPLR